MTDMILYHLRHLGYSMADLAAALNLFEPEFRSNYLPTSPLLQLIR